MIACHGEITGPGHYAIDISHPGSDFKLTIERPGAYALFGRLRAGQLS